MKFALPLITYLSTTEICFYSLYRKKACTRLRKRETTDRSPCSFTRKRKVSSRMGQAVISKCVCTGMGTDRVIRMGNAILRNDLKSNWPIGCLVWSPAHWPLIKPLCLSQQRGGVLNLDHTASYLVRVIEIDPSTVSDTILVGGQKRQIYSYCKCMGNVRSLMLDNLRTMDILKLLWIAN